MTTIIVCNIFITKNIKKCDAVRASISVDFLGNQAAKYVSNAICRFIELVLKIWSVYDKCLIAN